MDYKLTSMYWRVVAYARWRRQEIIQTIGLVLIERSTIGNNPRLLWPEVAITQTV